MKIELRQLKYFIEIAREGHFGRASESLYISQSALSQQIQVLEKEIGVDLFDREKRIRQRKVELTEAGKFFLKEAREIVRKSEEAVINVRKLVNEDKILRLGFYSLAMRRWVVDIVHKISRVNPNLDVSLAEIRTVEEVRDSLLHGKIDIGMTLLPLDSDELAYHVIKHDQLGVIMSSGHPLAKKDVLYLKDLSEEKWVTIRKSLHPFYEYLENLCLSSGFSREKNIVQDASTHEVVCSLVSLNVGIAFMPLQFDLHHEPAIVAKKVLLDNKQAIKVDHALAWKKTRNKELEDIILKVHEIQ